MCRFVHKSDGGGGIDCSITEGEENSSNSGENSENSTESVDNSGDSGNLSTSEDDNNTNNNSSDDEKISASDTGDAYVLIAYANGGEFDTELTTYDEECCTTEMLYIPNANATSSLTIGTNRYCYFDSKPTREGYAFIGYYDQAVGGEMVYGIDGINVEGTYWQRDGTYNGTIGYPEALYVYEGDLVIYAHWAKYDEIEDYWYYEDGEYPQEEPSLSLEWHGDLNTSEIEASYDEELNILTLNGTAVTGTGSLIKACDVAFKEGQVYTISVELVGGSVTCDRSGSCMAFDVYDWEGSGYKPMSIYGSRNYLNLSLQGGTGTLTVNSTSEGYGNGFYIWVWENYSEGYTVDFDNAQYRITISYESFLEDAYEDGEMTEEYSLRIGEYTAVVYSNDVQIADAAAGTKFARIEVDGNVGWFAVEPIRWIVAYGSDAPTELTYAVSASVVTLGSYMAESVYDLSYMSLYATTKQSAAVNLATGSLAESQSDTITYDAFNTTTLSQTVVYSVNLDNATSANTVENGSEFRVASVYEIDEIGGGYECTCSALIAFILSGGTSTEAVTVDYWTRDLAYSFDDSTNYGTSSYSGGLGQGVYVTSAGTISNAGLYNCFGARLSVTL